MPFAKKPKRTVCWYPKRSLKKNCDANNSVPNSNTDKNNNNHNYKNSNRVKKNPENICPPCETCGKTNYSTEKCYYGDNAAKRPPPGNRKPERQNQVQERANQNDSNKTTQAAAQNLNWKCHVFTPELQLIDRGLLNFHQSLKLSGSNPRRFIYLKYKKLIHLY